MNNIRMRMVAVALATTGLAEPLSAQDAHSELGEAPAAQTLAIAFLEHPEWVDLRLPIRRWTQAASSLANVRGHPKRQRVTIIGFVPHSLHALPFAHVEIWEYCIAVDVALHVREFKPRRDRQEERVNLRAPDHAEFTRLLSLGMGDRVLFRVHLDEVGEGYVAA